MYIDQIRQDLRYALRQMLKAPGLTLVMIGMLAVGIGANSALYSVLDRVVSRGAPGVGDPEGMVEVEREVFYREVNRFGGVPLSYPDFLDFRELRSVFADLAVTREIRVGVRTRGLAVPLRGYLVSSSYFSVLRVQMALGTGFPRSDDARPDANPLVVVSHRFWQQRLEGASNVIGQYIEVQGIPFTIVGVAPPMFNGQRVLEDDYEVWLPVGTLGLIFPETGASLVSRDSARYDMLALLQQGVSSGAAESVATATARRIAEAHPLALGPRRSNVTARVRSLTLVPREDLGEAILILSWVGGTPIWLTLLVVCANVSSLLLGRAVMRRNEIAVRLSLGAGRGRVIRQLLTESVLLALLASGAGLLLLIWATTYFQSKFPAELDVPIQWRTVGFAVAFASAVGILFGLMPALHAGRTSVFAALKQGAGLDRRGSKLQQRFVVAQLTLSLPLLVAAGWYMAGAQRITAAASAGDSGTNALGVTLNLDLRDYSEAQSDALLTAARERIASLPGVRDAAFASMVPFFSGSSYDYFIRSTRDLTAARAQTRPDASSIDPGYLRLMRIPILRGRGIETSDHAGAPLVAVVSEDYARVAWPNEDALGKPLYTRVLKDTSWVELTATVVGIAGTAVRNHWDEPHVVYVPRKQLPARYTMTLVVRSAGPALDLMPAIRRELEGIDPHLPMSQLETFQRRRHESYDIERKVARYSLLAGLLVLVIASVGVYAVVSFSVAQRTREIGIRMALGARVSQVTASYVRQGIRLGLFGLAIGLPITLILRLAFTRLLYSDAAALDVLAVIAVALTLVIVAALASLLPARRAAAVNPVDTLRTE